ncbi:MAG: hypothetical protein NC299_02175 [Lachnospiraceae bacterium]|nr:hypothetical protein [Ruminococcus sp.]MCM1274155.1 hypothetical protein [Lachnospiraceae bacterium]
MSTEDKRSRIMLDISSWLMTAYCVLFLGCYDLQYVPWKMGWLDGVMGISFPTEVSPVYSPAIILSTLVFSAATAVLDYLLKKRSGSGICIGAAAFAVCAFVADRLVKGLVPTLYTRMMIAEGIHGVALAGYHANAVHFLDMLLLPLFAVSLALMACVCYNKRVISI